MCATILQVRRERNLSKGWKKAEICGLINRTTEMEPEDPFKIDYHVAKSRYTIKFLNANTLLN